MNRLHRFGTALFVVGGAGAGISILVLMNSYAFPDIFWPAIIAGVVCGVIAGAGYVIQETFADPLQPTRSRRRRADADAGGEPPHPPVNSPPSTPPTPGGPPARTRGEHPARNPAPEIP